MPRSLVSVLAVASAFAVASIALSGCASAPVKESSENCAGVVSKVLLTDDSATTVATFSPTAVPKAFDVPATPAPTCFYSSTAPLPPQDGIVYNDSHRTLLYIGLSDSEVASIIASLRKTVSVAPWTVRFDYGAAPAPTPGATATPTPATSNSSSARWYLNFSGGPSEDKGEMGYYLTQPISQGTTIQAGLSKPVNVLRIETDLRQVKK